MKTKRAKIMATVATVVFTLILALPYLVNIDRFRPQLESSLKSALGREVHVGHMELSLLAGGARVEQISIEDDPAFKKGTFLQAKSLGVGVSLLSLIFSRSLHVTTLTIEEPKMTAIKSPEGKWNFASLGNTNRDQQQKDKAASTTSSGSSMSSIVLDRIKISNATIELSSGQHHKATTLKNIDVDLKNVSLDSAMTFSISAAAGDGKLQIEGNAGPIQHGEDADAESTIVHMKINGNHVPLDSIEVFLPSLGIVLPGGSTLRGGTVNAKLSLDGPIDRLVTSGNVEVAKAHLKGFDLGSKMSALPGMSSAMGGSDLAILNLSTHLRVGPEGTKISAFNGQFGGIGSVTGDGDVSASNHLQFKMVAHVPSDGAVRFGLDHIGLRSLPNDVPFQVVGTTSMPLIIADLSGMAKKTAKVVAANATKKAVTRAVASQTKSQMPAQTASNKKGGFFHNLFRRKNKQTNAANSTQLASQNTKY
jgi:hypothetical protein